MTEIYNTASPAETEKVGRELAEKLSEKLSFVCLYGDLGAGKTAFVRGFTSFFVPEAKVKSPTYSVVNEYRNGDTAVFHFDLYRFEDNPESLYDIGFDDYVAGGHCVFEWSEYMPEGAEPDDAVRVTIEKTGEETRKITINTED